MEQKRRISDIAFEYAHRLRADPNIRAVGYGVKVRAGAVVTGRCLVFYVRRKLATVQDGVCCGTWWVPPMIEGFQTDVVVVLAATEARSMIANFSRTETDYGERRANG